MTLDEMRQLYQDEVMPGDKYVAHGPIAGTEWTWLMIWFPGESRWIVLWQRQRYEEHWSVEINSYRCKGQAKAFAEWLTKVGPQEL